MTINHTAEPGEIRFLKKFSFTLKKKHFLPYSIYDIFPGQGKRTAEPFQIEKGVPNWFRRWTFHVLYSMY